MAGQWWVVQVPSGLPRDPGLLAKTVRQEPLPADAVKVSGPYATQAEAQKALDGATGGDPSLPHQAATAGGFSIPNPLHGIDELAGAITGFFGVITDVTLWRSLGWLLLGAILIIAGLWLWLKGKGVVPDVVPVPV